MAHHFFSRALLSVGCAFVLLPGLAAQSADYSGAVNIPTYDLNILTTTNGTLGSQDVALSVTSAGMQVTVNPSTPSLIFDTFDVQTGATTSSSTQNISTGFGQSANFTVSLSIAPTVFLSTPSGDVQTLIPKSGGRYAFPDNAVSSATAQWVLNGTYTVTGPSHSATGSFQINGTTFDYLQIPFYLDTSSYPGSLSFAGSGFNFSQHAPTTPPIFDVTVDGQHIQWGLFTTLVSFSNVTMTPGDLAPVPEPATCAALFAIAGLAFAGVRRWRQGRNGCVTVETSSAG